MLYRTNSTPEPNTAEPIEMKQGLREEITRRAFIAGATRLSGCATCSLITPRWRDSLFASYLQDAAATRGGSLTFARPGFEDLDPITQGAGAFVLHDRMMLFGSLVRYDVNLNLVGDLANVLSPERDEDEDIRGGGDWFFPLREGVIWHDGSPLTADDVKYTIERIKDPSLSSYLAEELAHVQSVEVDDQFSVRIVLDGVYASFLDTLTRIPIVKKDSADSNRSQPIGTGPFRFESGSPQDDIVYVRFDGYFNPELPLLDEVIMRPGETDLATSFIAGSGEVDAVSDQILGFESIRSLIQEPSSQVRPVAVDLSSRLFFAELLTKTPPFDNPLVRQGLAQCLDREQIQAQVFGGTGTPTDNFVPVQSWAYLELPAYPYDPEQASALFAEAGYSAGFDLTIDIFENEVEAQIGEIWRVGLESAGISANIRTNASAAWSDRYTSGEYQMILNFRTQSPDPHPFISDIYLRHINNGDWTDEALNQQVLDLSSAANGTTDREERKALYAELQQLLHSELPVIPAFRPPIVTAASDRVGGLPINGMGLYFLEQAWVVS